MLIKLFERILFFNQKFFTFAKYQKSDMTGKEYIVKSWNQLKFPRIFFNHIL